MIEFVGQRSSRWVGLGLVGLLLLSGCAEQAASGGRGQGPGRRGGSETVKETIPVRVAPVARQDVASLYVTSATVRADKRATIIARTRGVVERLMVEEGQTVDADQPVAQLEHEEQQIQYERARTTLQQSRRAVERAEGLHESSMMSDEDFELARREAEDAEQAAALAELELSRTEIRAPFSGTILRRHLDVGATVADGTPVFDIADLEPLYVDVNVPERHVVRLEEDQAVRLTTDAADRSYDGRIELISPEVDPSTGTVRVRVRVEAADLRPGAFVRVDIVTDVHPDALVVPRSALVAEGRRWHLFRLAPEGASVEQIEVALGYEEGDVVEILPSPDGAELSTVDRIVVSGASALTDGSGVEVMEAEGGSGDSAGEGKGVAS